MTELEELNEIDLREGVLEVTIMQGNPDELIEEVKRIVKRNGYKVIQILNERNVYYIHYE